jgi:hypothetical protein
LEVIDVGEDKAALTGMVFGGPGDWRPKAPDPMTDPEGFAKWRKEHPEAVFPKPEAAPAGSVPPGWQRGPGKADGTFLMDADPIGPWAGNMAEWDPEREAWMSGDKYVDVEGFLTEGTPPKKKP